MIDLLEVKLSLHYVFLGEGVASTRASGASSMLVVFLGTAGHKCSLSALNQGCSHNCTGGMRRPASAPRRDRFLREDYNQ